MPGDVRSCLVAHGPATRQGFVERVPWVRYRLAVIRQLGAVAGLMIVAGVLGAVCGGTPDGPAALKAGRGIYGDQCSACHGNRGQGGVGPSMAEVRETWPDCDDHQEWIALGSEGWKAEHGPTYGADDARQQGDARAGRVAGTRRDRQGRCVRTGRVRRRRRWRPNSPTAASPTSTPTSTTHPTTRLTPHRDDSIVTTGGLTMSVFAPSAGLAGPPASRFTAAAAIFTYTIVIGILNGIDIWDAGTRRADEPCAQRHARLDHARRRRHRVHHVLRRPRGGGRRGTAGRSHGDGTGRLGRPLRSGVPRGRLDLRRSHPTPDLRHGAVRRGHLAAGLARELLSLLRVGQRPLASVSCSPGSRC